MAPVALATRPDGEYLVVHECLSCGVVRHCRVAADDNWSCVMALPLTHRHGAAVATTGRLDESA